MRLFLFYAPLKTQQPASPPFERFVPPAAVAYCQSLWEQHEFRFRVARPRRTRLGTHVFHAHTGHEVTVNANLNPAGFLITYLHEVAHVVTVREALRRVTKRRPAPHGMAWKTNFRRLLLPVLTEDFFPPAVLEPLRVYAQNPAASTAGFPPLAQALLALDTPLAEALTLHHLREGETFRFHQRLFVRGPLRRTRVLCTEQATGRRYTVPAHAPIERAEGHE